jgi:hypothetical protein
MPASTAVPYTPMYPRPTIGAREPRRAPASTRPVGASYSPPAGWPGDGRPRRPGIGLCLFSRAVLADRSLLGPRFVDRLIPSSRICLNSVLVVGSLGRPPMTNVHGGPPMCQRNKSARRSEVPRHAPFAQKRSGTTGQPDCSAKFTPLPVQNDSVDSDLKLVADRLEGSAPSASKRG